MAKLSSKWTRVWFGCCMFLCTSLSFAFGRNEGGESFISISGKTNINSFNLRQDIALLDFMPSPIGNQYVRVSVAVKQFETDNPIMYNDFIELVKAKQYPHIYIDLLRSDFLALQEGKIFEQSVKIFLTIAGITRSYNLQSEIAAFPNECFSLKGQRDILLPDFKIDPPVKFLGMIKVQDTVHINFNLAFCMKTGAFEMATK
ncbi:MAG: YceI family protein [Breznakibacter sp.]